MSSPEPIAGASVKYSQQYRRCGKPNCPTCAPPARGHGPYWYAFWWADGRVRSRYLGKQLPNAVSASPQPVPLRAPARGLRVQTLGGFQVWRAGEPLPAGVWGRKKATALFKALLSVPGCRLHREALIDLLVPDLAPAEGARWLRSAVYLLRKVLDTSGAARSHLQVNDDLVTLLPALDGEPEVDWLDATLFERTATTALAGRDIARCRAAAGLYHGEYLPEDRYEAWAERRREELRAQYQAVLLGLADLSRKAGDHEEAVRCLRTVLVENRSHEDAARELMELLALGGQRWEALEVYRSLAQALEEDLGQPPARETRALRARLLAAAHIVHLSAARRTNLPTPLTSFVGREWERSEVARLLRGESGSSRLVSLLGPGGCGKTRLALEVARGLLDEFQDGIWLAELAGLPPSEESDPVLPAQAVALALGLHQVAGHSVLDGLVDHLAARRLLLVLDNCEHLIGSCAALAASLLAAAPGLQILATSQTALGTLGETAWRVPSLSLPERDDLPPAELLAYEAVQLFMERGTASVPRFALTERNAGAVARICRRLDGIPLALELAAARLTALSADGLAARLDDRLALLTAGNRAAPPRQQTLRATIAWSVGLLSSAERLLLLRLAVFMGGWTLEAAEAVCAGRGLPQRQVFERLHGLVSKSLVQVEEIDTTLRYRSLESIRAYAEELGEAAGELERARNLHLLWCLALVEGADAALRGPEQAGWLARLESEHDNLRAALGRVCDEGAGEAALQLTGQLWRFWSTRGYVDEGRRWLDAALAAGSEISTAVRGLALNGAGNLAFQQGDYAPAAALHQESLALRRELGDARGVAGSLANLGTIAFLQGDYQRTSALHEEALEGFRTLQDRWGIAGGLNNLANVAFQRGQYRRAAALYGECLALYRELQDRSRIAGTLANLGLVVYRQGDYARAAALQEEALAMERELGNRLGEGFALGHLGIVTYQQGDHARATALEEECLAQLREQGATHNIAVSLGNLAEMATMDGNLAHAEALFDESLALQRRLGEKYSCARSLTNLGTVAYLQGNHARALSLFREGLLLSREIGAMDEQAVGVEGLAWLAATSRSVDHAARLSGAAAAIRATLGASLPPIQRAGHALMEGTMRAALTAEAFSALWAEGQALRLEQAVDLALVSLASGVRSQQQRGWSDQDTL